ncbi:MAG: ribonuclease HII [Anaerolineae bacterium]|jgi:ribonuclease HII|nr:ribonuclease HII [Anaerolineae bacterium]MDH7473033.1 ribonuclease HII [Anaerolineae bacterium]
METRGRNQREKPTLAEEYVLRAQGYQHIAGLDEAGRGAWAGPVVAAAVILPLHDPALNRMLDGVRDSKQLSARQRDALYGRISAVAVAIGIGIIAAEVIDALGIVPATRQAMAAAVQQLSPPPDFLLIDALHLEEVALPQKGIIKGDAKCLSIAAASIIAKVTRDRLLMDLEEKYPGYGFARHKGYGTRQHRAALNHLGPCDIHRRSYAPVRSVGQDSLLSCLPTLDNRDRCGKL